jgi:hypothetical protein
MLNLAKYAGMAALVMGLVIAATKPASAWDYSQWGYDEGPQFYGFAYPYPSYGYHPYYHPQFYGYYGYQPFYYYRLHRYRRW